MTRHFFLLASLLSVALAQVQTTQQSSQQISLDPNAGPLKLRIVFQSDQQQAQQQSPCSTGNCQATPTLSPCASGNCGSSVQQVQPIQPVASPCSTGNCGQQTVQQSPCSSGNCNGLVTGNNNIVPAYDASTITVPSPTFPVPQPIVLQTTTPLPVAIRTVSSNSAPVKVIRIPSYSNSGCFSPPCGGPRFVFAQPPCFGNSCGNQRFFYPRRRHFFGPRPIFIGNTKNNNINNGGSIAIPDTIYRNGQAIRAPIRVPSSYTDGNPVFNSGK